MANAAGLGKLVVLSAMGEPFRAEIDLLGVAQYPEERATLTPLLAPPGIYPFADFRYDPALTGTRLNIRTRPNGRHVIEVVSVRPLNEPFVYLLVELESNTTRIVRGYTALLDPQGYRASQATVVAEYLPAVVPTAAPAAKPATVVRPPVADRAKAAARSLPRSAPRQERLSDADAKTLAAMLARVAALEAAVAQLQRHWEKSDVVAADAPPAPKPVTAKAAPVAAPPPPVVHEKPVPAAESALHRASNQDSILNEALLVLAVGLLLLLGGLVYVMWGRPAVQERLAKGGG